VIGNVTVDLAVVSGSHLHHLTILAAGT